MPKSGLDEFNEKINAAAVTYIEEGIEGIRKLGLNIFEMKSVERIAEQLTEPNVTNQVTQSQDYIDIASTDDAKSILDQQEISVPEEFKEVEIIGIERELIDEAYDPLQIGG
ncbi:MAG TPA: hypothetical protein DCP90_06225 [Clostridiales bacterium]|nr:MAG: hypothetical protein A2Y22_08230 [Clostridiales bacterium GWD2_32_59]HAN10191.1 hypothetical protein [Clostridiales bacterium]